MYACAVLKQKHVYFHAIFAEAMPKFQARQQGKKFSFEYLLKNANH